MHKGSMGIKKLNGILAYFQVNNSAQMGKTLEVLRRE